MNRNRWLPSAPGRIVLCWLLIFCGQLGMEGFSSRAISAGGIEILTPLPSATIAARNPETHLVLRRPVSQKEEQLRVQAGAAGIEAQAVRQHQGSEYLHFRLPLKPGANLFTIAPSGQRLEIRYEPLRANVTAGMLGKDVYLFHRDSQLPAECASCHDLQKTKPIGSLGLAGQESCAGCHGNITGKARFQHSTTVNNLCLTCHQQFVKPWRIGFPVERIEGTCISCHTSKRVWRSRKSIHGPMNVGGCTVCHNPHGDENRHQLWADGSATLCVTCHSDKENLVRKDKSMRFVHGVINGPGCVACHDPHATENRFVLIKPINELCVGCHQGLAGVTRGHPVGGHPVAGPAERRRQGRELSCTSCHDPHASPYRYLLIGTALGGQFCRECHK